MAEGDYSRRGSELSLTRRVVDSVTSSRRRSSTTLSSIDAKPSKTFEFRMCKKVSELTQVVHMLFTRNHEKEVELDALRDAYEDEIDSVISDAKSRIEKLENKIRTLEQTMTQKDATSRASVAAEVARVNAEYSQKLQELESVLNEEKNESKNVRDLLITAQRDIEQLRAAIESENEASTSAIQSKERDIEKHNNTIQQLKEKLKANESANEQSLMLSEATNSRLRNELLLLQEDYEETLKTRDKYANKVKQLDADLKLMRKDFGRRVSEVVGQSKARPVRRKQSEPSLLDYKQELERLRRELQRYRLELSNREGNFNRVFSEHKPVLLDSRAGMLGLQQQQSFNNNNHYDNLNISQAPASSTTSARIADKVQGYATVESYDDSPIILSRSVSALSAARFPSLSLGGATLDLPKSPVPRLVKPKLPRELTSSGRF